MPFTTFLIDLDETVYPTACGVWEAISERMEQYMHDRLNLSWEEIPALRKQLYQQYGTTLRGLQTTRRIDEREYVDYVHDVPLAQFLAPDPGLRDVLLTYPQRKVIFTNADRNHARRVMEIMQITDCFADMIDIFDIAPYCKPMQEAFKIALSRSGENQPEACVFMDDSPHNLSEARALGFFTIQVGSPKPGYRHPDSLAHAHIARLSDLPEVIDPATGSLRGG
jgi:putative hydrolase of the HAD superfamily